MFFSLFRLVMAGLLNTLLVHSVANAQIITTIAGPNNVGDGGQAVSATLDEPTATCTDLASNMYIAEGSSHRIRKVAQRVLSRPSPEPEFLAFRGMEARQPRPTFTLRQGLRLTGQETCM